VCRIRSFATGSQPENEFLMKELINLNNPRDLVFPVPAIVAFGTFLRVDERSEDSRMKSVGTVRG
jgi:hypothetical protein